MLCIEGQIQKVTRIKNIKFPDIVRNVFYIKGEIDMGDKGSKDKGKKEQRKKAQLNPKEKRKRNKEKKNK
jgi:hypothetical protein